MLVYDVVKALCMRAFVTYANKTDFAALKDSGRIQDGIGRLQAAGA